MSQSKIFGIQEWSLINLNVDHFANGDLIPEVKSHEDWVKANSEKKPAWCYYSNDPMLGCVYGKLYNWYAVTDPREICPKGWHIPTDSEWTELIETIGGYRSSGKKLKSKSFWENSNHQGTNESDFNALPSGYRNFYGDFFFLNLHGYFWSATQHYNHLAWYHTVDFSLNEVLRYYNVKGNGFSCRCIKNN